MYKQLKRKLIQYYCDAHIEVLEAARERIARRDADYVCIAIWDIMQRSLKLKLAGKHIRDMIRESLNGHNYVELWLEEAIGQGWREINMREYRLAWIDYIIEGWKIKRDNA